MAMSANPLKENPIPNVWDEGDYTVHRTTAWSAPGCHLGCGVLCYVNNKTGKLEKVEGDPNHPFNQGHLCPRCATLPQTLYNDKRLLYPMKRAREDRGKDKWERISWDEAIDIIVSEFKRIADTYGPESICGMRGTGRDLMYHNERVVSYFGSPNNLGALSGNSCYVPRLSAYVMQSGAFSVADCSQFFESRYDEENTEWRCPKVIVNWGCNPVVSNPDNFFGDWIVQCMKRGAKLINIDPRMTWLSAQADVWINLRPATDTAVAIAMLKTIVDEDLYDHEFVDLWCYGFDKMKEAIDQYSYEFLAETCGVDLERLQKAARLYATSKPAAMQLGVKIDMQHMGSIACLTISDMIYICGNLDVPGGNVLVQQPYGITFPGDGGWGLGDLTEEQFNKMMSLEKHPITQYGMKVVFADDGFEQIVTGEPYPIMGAWIQGTNVLACMGQDPDAWRKGYDRMEFVAGADIWMTPSLMDHADVVLPAATWAEKDGLRVAFYNVSTINKVIEPLGECKSDADIIRLIGNKANPELMPYKSEREINQWFLQGHGHAPFNYEEAQRQVCVCPGIEYRRYEKGLLRPDGQPGFNTPTGRLELSSTLLDRMGYHSVPYYEEPVQSPVSTPELFKEYPLITMTGARSHYFHSEGRQIPAQREIMPDPLVYLNPNDAKKYGIKEGQWVWVESPKDRVKQKAKVTAEMQEGQALASHGFWYPEADNEDLYDRCREVNVGRLVEYGHTSETGFGADIASVLCKVYPVKEGE